ncbi:hypothetical protein PABG_05200 [Paracoccidioides brasiliensis Pb03]|nr:hypothetical protein PABG_05200 [Paracoccidioides brasiliensis Pb03]
MSPDGGGVARGGDGWKGGLLGYAALGRLAATWDHPRTCIVPALGGTPLRDSPVGQSEGRPLDTPDYDTAWPLPFQRALSLPRDGACLDTVIHLRLAGLDQKRLNEFNQYRERPPAVDNIITSLGTPTPRCSYQVHAVMDWYPARFFNSPTPPSSPFALLILNQPINEKACKILKKHASFTICADGGANRFYTLMQRWEKEFVELPDAIVGDLDSISPHVRMFYESLHVPVIHDPDQEYTDFTKCLRYIQSRRAAVAAAAAAAATKDTHNSSPTSSAPAPAPAPRTAETHPAFDVLILGGLGGRQHSHIPMANYTSSPKRA